MSKVLLIDNSVDTADLLHGKGQHSVSTLLPVSMRGLFAIQSGFKEVF